MINRFIHNQVGSTLINAMVAASVVAGAALVGTKILTDQKAAQKSSESRDRVEDLHKLVVSVLQNRDNCEETLTRSGIMTSLANGGTQPINGIYVNNNATPVIDITQPQMNNTVRITGMQVNFDRITGAGTLDVTYKHLNDNNDATRTKGIGARDIKKSVAIKVQRDPFSAAAIKPITSCYVYQADKDSVSSESGNELSEQLCREMNNNNSNTGNSVFKWDSVLNTCIPDANCPADSIYTGFDSNGQVKCRKINEWFDFSNVLDTTSGASCPDGTTVRLEITGTRPNQKVHIRCN